MIFKAIALLEKQWRDDIFARSITQIKGFGYLINRVRFSEETPVVELDELYPFPADDGKLAQRTINVLKKLNDAEMLPIPILQFCAAQNIPLG